MYVTGEDQLEVIEWADDLNISHNKVIINSTQKGSSSVLNSRNMMSVTRTSYFIHSSSADSIVLGSRQSPHMTADNRYDDRGVVTLAVDTLGKEYGAQFDRRTLFTWGADSFRKE